MSSSGPIKPSCAVSQFNILTTIPGGALNQSYPTELLPDSCRLDLWEMMNAGFLFVGAATLEGDLLHGTSKSSETFGSAQRRSVLCLGRLLGWSLYQIGTIRAPQTYSFLPSD